jgi:hypothetical protein
MLDADYVTAQEERVTRAWRRLQELPGLGIPIIEYPLPEVRAALKKQAEEGEGGPPPAPAGR